jgi:hypothetical protein
MKAAARSLAALSVVGLMLAGPVCAQEAAFRLNRSSPLHSANVISDETRFVVDGHSARLIRELVVQVFGPEGRDHGRMEIWHDGFQRVRSLEGQIRDADGNVVRRLRRADIRDRPATDGFSLYDELRIRTAELYHDQYPYRIEWKYEIDYQTLLNWPTWYPQSSHAAVQLATLTVDVPATFSLRYRSQFLDDGPVVNEGGSRTTYQWRASAPPRGSEPLASPLRERIPAVHFAPNAFRVDRSSGSLASWREFGQWYRDLSTGLDPLPPQASEEVRNLVAGIDDPLERARLVYGFLQRRTRYVSVQLGLGGWKPFDAAYVHDRRYGDCKALTNYLQALLGAVGVESFPALIGADRPDTDPDFPRNNFNHVVLFLPMGGAPVWLEATSQHLPFGYLDSGTEGRNALVVTPEGGTLVRTPVWSARANAEEKNFALRVRPDGSIEATLLTTYRGHRVGALRSELSRMSASDREDWLASALGVRGSVLNEVRISGLERGTPDSTLTIAATLSADRHATRAGRRLLVNPNLTRRPLAVPPEVEHRTQPVRAFRHAFLDRDTVQISTAEGLRLELSIEPVDVDVGFARYAVRVEEDGPDLLYIREFEIREPELPAEQYADLHAFLTRVLLSDERMLVFLVGE